MITNKEFRDLALSFPGTEQNLHFDRQAFKVIKKRIFATIHEPTKSANLKLPLVEQSVFCDFSDAVYPVPNKWGKQGWTTFELLKVPKELVLDALGIAYTDVMNKTKKHK